MFLRQPTGVGWRLITLSDERRGPYRVSQKPACWLFHKGATAVTSPEGAVAKYRDQYVCLSACLSVREDISGTIRAIFTKFFVHVAYVHGSVSLIISQNIYSGLNRKSISRTSIRVEK